MNAINASLQNVKIGSAKTYEHLTTKFAFRMEGDGALEPVVTDKFALSDPIVENLSDRRFRQFLKTESDFAKPENVITDAQDAQAGMEKIVSSTLGEGWQVDSFSVDGGGHLRRTEVSFSNENGTQTVNIQRYESPEVSLKAQVSMDGWKVSQSIDAKISDGAVDVESVNESGYFSQY